MQRRSSYGEMPEVFLLVVSPLLEPSLRGSAKIGTSSLLRGNAPVRAMLNMICRAALVTQSCTFVAFIVHLGQFAGVLRRDSRPCGAPVPGKYLGSGMRGWRCFCSLRRPL